MKVNFRMHPVLTAVSKLWLDETSAFNYKKSFPFRLKWLTLTRIPCGIVAKGRNLVSYRAFWCHKYLWMPLKEAACQMSDMSHISCHVYYFFLYFFLIFFYFLLAVGK